MTTVRRAGTVRARYGASSTEQMLGALPVVAGFCRRLDIAGIIDRAAPVREVAYATHGQVIEALIANRLTWPLPMIHVGAWAHRFAVGHVLGLDAGVLNDDRIARALDALAPVLEEVTGSIGAAAIAAYGVDVSQLHWDMTSVSLYGDYPACDQDFPQPRFGHPKDRRPDLKQIQAGIATAADGSVPVFWQPYGGGVGEVCQVVGAMEALRRLAGPRRFLLVGDSKLLSYTNIAAMIDAQVTFLAPASKSFVPAAVLAGCDHAAATPVEYLAQRDTTRPADNRGHYRVLEDTATITGSRKKDPSFTVRRVFVHSSARAGAAATARAKKLDRARDDLARLTRGLGSRHYPSAEAVTARVNTIARERRVGAYLRTTTGTDHRGRPTLDWHFDQDAIDAETATDGWYALLTNLPPTVTAAHVLTRYKNQPAASERRYHDLKGPLAVAPMFLHTNRRITALIGIVCLALLIYCLIEREARRNLAPATKLDGLYAGRPAKPTTGLIFAALTTLRLRTSTSHGTPEIPQPDALQLRLLDLLKIDPRRPR
jgi:transposase